MSNIDKQWLQQKIADMEATRDEIPFGLDEDDSNTLAALRIALASLEAEPAIHRWRRVTVEPYGPYPWHYGNFIGFSKPVEGIEDEYFYPAPPTPVSAPDEATPENIEILASTYAPRGVTYQWDSNECNAAADSWNACRTAMLQSFGNSEQLNSPVIPDGWKLVPVIAFPSQWAAGQKAFNSAGINKVDAVYKAMVAAAPQQEA